jgi:hypothetical protein
MIQIEGIIIEITKKVPIELLNKIDRLFFCFKSIILNLTRIL